MAWREDLDPVPERVARAGPVAAGQGFVEGDLDGLRGEATAEAREVVDKGSWAGLAGGDERVLDAEVDLERGGAEPATRAALEVARLTHRPGAPGRVGLWSSRRVLLSAQEVRRCGGPARDQPRVDERGQADDFPA